MKFLYCAIPIIIFSIYLNAGCINKKQIDLKFERKKINLGSLKPFVKDTSISYYNVSLLKAFPTHHKCDGDDRYVNLYICRNDNTRDTIIVFQTCRTPPEFLMENSKFKNTLSFDNADVEEKYPKSVFIDLPVNFRLNKNLKYVFVQLEILSE
jgi:hypothetical protein